MAALGLCFITPAKAITISVGGNQYDITTAYQNGLTPNATTSAPWWGNAALAEQLAAAVNTQLGTPNFETNAWGPWFAYSIADNPSYPLINVYGWYMGGIWVVEVIAVAKDGLDHINFPHKLHQMCEPSLKAL